MISPYYDEEDIVLLAPDGEDEDEDSVQAFIFVALVEVEGLEYAILVPKEQIDNQVEVPEIHLFGYDEDEDGEEVYSEIEDEALWEKVKAEADKILSE